MATGRIIEAVKRRVKRGLQVLGVIRAVAEHRLDARDFIYRGPWR
jgi:hypothetical protein